jgi:hypothetical protein
MLCDAAPQGLGLRLPTDRYLLPATLCFLTLFLFESMPNLTIEPKISETSALFKEPNVCSTAASGNSVNLLRFP